MTQTTDATTSALDPWAGLDADLRADAEAVAAHLPATGRLGVHLLDPLDPCSVARASFEKGNHP